MNAGTSSSIEDYTPGYLGAVLLDDSMIIEDISDGVVTFSGHPREAVIGLMPHDLLHPDDLERAGEAMLELATTQLPTVDGIYRMRFVDGSYGDFAVQGLPVSMDGQAKTVMRFSAVSAALRSDEFARDAVDTLRMVSETRQLDECLERVHHLAERHLPGTSLAISTIQADVIRTHRRLSDGSFSADERQSAVPPHVESAFAQHLEGPWRAFNRMAEFGPTPNGAVVTSVLTDDSNDLLGYVEATITSTAELDDREWMVHGLVRQLLASLLRRLKLDEQLRHAADTDPLTGLANRRRFFNDMAAAKEIAGTTLLLIDLDNFSWINNNLGHHVGDQTLTALANRLRELCPADATVARFGGDEFVVWSPELPADAGMLDQALRSSTLMPPSNTDRRRSVRCSIGVIMIQPGESATDAVKRADEAMYVAKNAGGDSLQVA